MSAYYVLGSGDTKINSIIGMIFALCSDGEYSLI